MKIVTVLGARPQFIKAAAVSRLFLRAPVVREILVHTGQHYDQNLSEIFFRELGLPKPDYNLGIGSGNHGAQTGRMLEAIEQVLITEMPDMLLVYGDTNSTLAGALAAAKLHIPVAHIEAGLRSFNRRMPEELNRVLTDHVSSLLFAPTQSAITNLVREGVSAEKIHRVGDVMYDAALYYGAKAEQTSTILDKLGLTPGNYVLATIHRAENTDDAVRLRRIFDALNSLAQTCRVVVPLHPRTREALRNANYDFSANPGLSIIDPVGYLDMVMLEKHARLIATDSGGVQKEAFFYKVPCATLREETEWVELVESGWNTLAPPDDSVPLRERLEKIMQKTIVDLGHDDFYGSGAAAEQIVSIMRKTTAD